MGRDGTLGGGPVLFPWRARMTWAMPRQLNHMNNPAETNMPGHFPAFIAI
jgi:hypothetical protein